MSQDDGFDPSSHRDLPPLPPSLDPRIQPQLNPRPDPRADARVPAGRGRRRARSAPPSSADAAPSSQATGAARRGGGWRSAGGRHSRGRHSPSSTGSYPTGPGAAGTRSGGTLRTVGKYLVRGLAAILAVVTLASAGWASYLRGVAESNVTRTQAIPSEGNVDQPGVDGQAMNILLVGNDSRGGATQEQLVNDLRTEAESGLNTDTMLLMHVPADGSRASVVSFPRDSYVKIPGYGYDKLNAAYGYGYGSVPESAPEADKRAAAQQLLVQTISALSGLGIDHYVEVGLLGFFNIANLIGGVEVNLCKPVDDEFSGLSLPAGPQVISGADALAFVRQRHGLENGDLDRIRRQQYFLAAVARKLLTPDFLLDPTKQHELITQVSQNLTVDEGLDLFQLAEQLEDLATDNLEFRTIPLNEPRFGTRDGMDVVLLASHGEITSFFAGLSAEPAATTEDPEQPEHTEQPAPGGEAGQPPAPENVPPEQVTVEVLNGSGAAGAAGAIAETLGTQGFQVSGVGNADRSDYATTLILYPPGQEAQAATLQSAVPGSTLQADSSGGTALRLVIGQNDPAAGGAGAPAPPVPPASPAQPPPPDLTAAETGCIN